MRAKHVQVISLHWNKKKNAVSSLVGVAGRGIPQFSPPFASLGWEGFVFQSKVNERYVAYSPHKFLHRYMTLSQPAKLCFHLSTHNVFSPSFVMVIDVCLKIACGGTFVCSNDDMHSNLDLVSI